MSDIKLHLSGRRTGRTTEMLDWLVESEPTQKRVIVTFSEADADRLYKLAVKRCATVERWQFISSRSDSQKLHGRKIYEVGIDNLEFFLRHAVGINAPVTKVTATLAEDHKFGHQSGFVLALNTDSAFTAL